METLTEKKLTTTRGFTYTYCSHAASNGLPTILLVHGWPDRASLWEDLINNHLKPAGYGIVAPDCLGYGATDKPTDANAYVSRDLSADIVQILDTEGLESVVVLGHDWGSFLASRIYLFFPDRVKGLVLMNVAYRPPSEAPFDLDKFNPFMQSLLGYSPYWYWELVLSEQGPKILEDHLESLWTILHGDGDSMIGTFGTKDGMKTFLLESKTQAVQEYATEGRKVEFLRQFKEEGMTAPLCWYKAQAFNLHFEPELAVSKELYAVQKPVLFIGGKHDKVGLTSGIYQSQKAGLLPNLSVTEVDAAHWVMLAKPKEVGDAVINWLKTNYGS